MAKVSEAEVMANHGFEDIFIAYPLVTPGKIRRALELAQEAQLCLAVDSIVGAEMIAKYARLHRITVDVRVEIDSGYGRTGAPAHRARTIAEMISNLSGIRLSGIFTFRENTFSDGTATLDIAAAGTEEGTLMSRIADELRASDIPITDVSAGSTPTALHAAAVAGVTEIRPGTYVFHDRTQHALGVCRREDIAAAVRATVVSRPQRSLAIIDAGSKAISVDTRPDEPPLYLTGYAEVVGRPEILLHRLSEEHGMLHLPDGCNLRVGEQVDLLPNHICTTVALHDSAAIIDSHGTVTFETVAARGKLT